MKILVVDDEDLNIKIARGNIIAYAKANGLDWEVAAASSRTEALGKAEGFGREPFFLLSDRQMPDDEVGKDNSGINLIETARLKQNCVGAVMVTGIAPEFSGEVGKALEAKGIKFFTKPAEWQEEVLPHIHTQIKEKTDAHHDRPKTAGASEVANGINLTYAETVRNNPERAAFGERVFGAGSLER